MLKPSAIATTAVLALAVGCTDAATAPTLDASVGADAVAAAEVGAKPDQAAADAAPEPVAVQTYTFCKGTTTLRYDPAGPDQVTTFPDDYHTKDDAKTPTGLRVAFDVKAPWIANGPAILSRAISDLNELNGWGTTAAVAFRFDKPAVGQQVALPSGPTSTQALGVVFADLGPIDAPSPPVRVPFEAQVTEDGKTVLLWPMLPLRPLHRHALVWTTDQKAADGGCIAPSPALIHLLQGDATDPKLLRLTLRARTALQALNIAPGMVSALALFTTQSTVQQSIAVAKDIAARKFGWSGPAVCTDLPLFRKCVRPFGAFDYRDGRLVGDGTPKTPYTLKVTAWLPKGPPQARPTAIFGHGLGSGRDQGEALAELAAPENLATIGIDAVAHGEHPTSDPVATGTLPTLIRFFGIDLGTLSVDGLKLRDNWRQSTYDKLQLLQVVSQHPDFDGDDKPDIDPAKLFYLGVSLGGIMGPELLALSSQIKVGVLTVPGARVASIISDSTEFGPIIGTLKPDNVSDADVVRFFPILQTLLDAGDSASYAPHVLKDRFDGSGEPPQLLMQMAIGDSIVPNSCNRALARALNLPVAPPVLQEVGLVPTLAKLPITGNLPTGQTAVLFQFDRISNKKGGPVEAAQHGNTPKSLEALTQDLHFIKTWLATGKAEAIDPYVTLGTPPLPPKP